MGEEAAAGGGVVLWLVVVIACVVVLIGICFYLLQNCRGIAHACWSAVMSDVVVGGESWTLHLSGGR